MMERITEKKEIINGRKAYKIIYDEYKSDSSISVAERQIGDRKGEFGCFLNPEGQKRTAMHYLREYPNVYVEYSYVQTKEGVWDHIVDWHKITAIRDRDDGSLDKLVFGWITSKDLVKESKAL